MLNKTGLLVLVELGAGRDRESGIEDLLLHTLLLLFPNVTLEHCVMCAVSSCLLMLGVEYSRKASSSRERP